MAKKNYNLLIGVAALVAVVLIVAIVGYIVSRPKDVVIQGEAEATEYRVSGKVPGRSKNSGPMKASMSGKATPSSSWIPRKSARRSQRPMPPGRRRSRSGTRRTTAPRKNRLPAPMKCGRKPSWART